MCCHAAMAEQINEYKNRIHNVYGMSHLIYDKTTKKLKLQTTGVMILVILKHLSLCQTVSVYWLTKWGTGILTVKASVSNYSATLTQTSYMAAQRNYTFKIFSEDAIIYKVMHTSIPNNTTK